MTEKEEPKTTKMPFGKLRMRQLMELTQSLGCGICPVEDICDSTDLGEICGQINSETLDILISVPDEILVGDVCEWKLLDFDECFCWNTSCGHENMVSRYGFCPHCGKRIKESK